MIIAGNKKKHYNYGNMLKLECVEGYGMLGDSVIQCLANGRWSRNKGKCSSMLKFNFVFY